MKKKIIILLGFVWLLSGCEDLLQPLDDNHQTLEDIYDDAVFAEGILMNAYTRIPSNGYSFNDVATDDAVTNDKFNGFRNAATGQWSSFYNPLEQWYNAYSAILYINKFLEEADQVTWSYSSEAANSMFNLRNKAEAYGLRALFYYYLLQAHGGYASGQLLGVPIITTSMESADEFETPRSTFEACVQQIFSDLNEAGKYLPLDYGDVEEVGEMPNRYREYSLEEYNRVFGDVARQRLSGRIVQAIRAKTALLAASPAFSEGTTTTWEDAANYAAVVLDGIGGVSGMDPNGALFYTASNVDRINLSAGRDQGEMLWRGSMEGGGGSLWLERDHFPPSLYGNGRVNPTQNLVDAFPMANGYPITDAVNSGYNAADPYADRDPRLHNYIVVNGDVFASSVIRTETGSGDDAVDQIKTSTRTGYYMRKLLREDVNVNPVSEQSKKHYIPRIRYTEIFLGYAEAANEAWGPDGAGSNGYSARDVIAAIRERAGITQPDAYLESISSREDMRALIRNERRLELCFEGFRFWDLRRWQEELNVPARGVRITNNVYEIATVEERVFEDYMNYGPLPYNDVVRSGLIQNTGW